MLVTDARIAAIKRNIELKKEPTISAFVMCEKEARWHLNDPCHAPDEWYVPLRYVDNEAHQKAKKCLHDDANNAYKMALIYRLTGDEKYGLAAVKLINGWATTVQSFSDKDDSRLAFSYHMPAMIFAADLLRDSPLFPKPDQDRFGSFLKEKGLAMTTMNDPAHNNGVDWGLLFYLSTALYLHDETMVHTALDRYKTDIDEQIKPDGILSSEITRNNSTGDAGYWYTNFALMPLTICTELFRIHGIDLYDYVSPKGGGLHKAYDKIADLMENPASYPFGTLYKSKLPHSLDQTFYAGYFEILNTRWPNREISTVLAGRRPWDPDHSLPATTLAYGDLKVPDGSATPVAE